MSDSHVTSGEGNELPLRPDDLLAFRLGRLLLLLDTVPALPSPRPMDIERISLYDFFADNPFLVFGRESKQHQTLIFSGFDSRNLSYQSSAQRFSSRRERLQHDLAVLLAHGFVSAEPQARRVAYELTETGANHVGELRSLYGQAYRRSAELVARELNRLSDRKLQEQTRVWLQADGLLIDIFETVPVMVGNGEQ